MRHLKEQNLTYMQHYCRVLKYITWCMKMYFVCTVHAIFPFWFEDTFSNEVKKMAAELDRKNED